MEMLSKNELISLTEKHMGICISLYMPTLKKGVEAQQQNQIRYKNLLKQTEEQLLAHELRPQEVKELLLPAQDISGDIPFWRSQQDGLAMFISEGFFKYYRLPKTIDELVIVTERFHLKPLIPLLSDEIEFYILSVTQKNAKLYECNQYIFKEIEFEEISENLAELFKAETLEKELQFNVRVNPGQAFSGHGGGIEKSKDTSLRFFQQVDRGVKEFLKEKKNLLIFAGVDYLFPIYKEANTYPFLSDAAIAGNPETTGPAKLHELALPLAKSASEDKKLESIALYQQSVGTGLASNNIREIIQSAHHGRIKILFVPVSIQQWGTYNPESQEIHLSDEPYPGAEDLLDFAAIQTFLNKGTVFALNPQEIPNNATIAAIYRY